MQMIEMIDVENIVYEKQLHCQGLAGDSGPCSHAQKDEIFSDQHYCDYDGCIITEQHVKRIESDLNKHKDFLAYCILQFLLDKQYVELSDYILMLLGETEFNTEGDDDLKDMIIVKMVELKVQMEIEEYEEAVNEC